ncbi:MAG: sensor histidine kinase [Lentisphaerota bacterium]
MLIKQKLVFALSVLLIAGFTTTSLISYYVSRGSLHKQIITNDLPLTSDNIYSEIQRDLLRPVLISSMMSNDTFLRNWILNGEKDVSQITQYLSWIKVHYNTFTSFFISEKTRIYYHAGGILKTVKEGEPRDIWYFRVRQMKQPYEINVDVDMAHKDTLTIFINHRVLDFNGEFIGTAGVGLNIDAVKALIESYHHKYKRTIYFVSPSGEIVLYSASYKDHAANIKNAPGIASVADNVLSGKSNKLEYETDGKTIFLNTRYIPELNWFLVVEQSSDTSTGNIFSTLVLNLVLCGFITIIILLITIFAINKYQDRLEKMMQSDMELKLINQEQEQEIANQNLDLLDKNTKLTLLNSSKDKLFSIIAHDLRGPVGNISQLLNMLAESYAAGDKEKMAEIFANLRGMSNTTFNLLENLFEWAKNQISDVIYSPEELNVNQLLQECLPVHQIDAKAKNITLTVSCGNTLKVFADANMLKTVIRNLVSNAIKFTPQNGYIYIKAELSNNNKILISIHDSGVGIEKSRIPVLFDFTRNKSTYGTNGEKGTGLGLALCRELIGLNKGEIHAESEPGKGSSFSFTLQNAGSSRNSEQT